MPDDEDDPNYKKEYKGPIYVQPPTLGDAKTGSYPYWDTSNSLIFNSIELDKLSVQHNALNNPVFGSGDSLLSRSMKK